MIPFNALPQSTLPEVPALRQPWLSTGVAAGFAVNAIGPRQMATARHTGLGVGSLVRLNDGTTRTVVSASTTPDVDVTVLTVDTDLPTWCPVREVTLFQPVDAMFISAGHVPGDPVVNLAGQTRGWFWGGQRGTLHWTRSETAYARYTLQDYEVTFREMPGSFAVTAGDSGGGFYSMDSNGQWFLQGIAVGYFLYNGDLLVNGLNTSQFRPAAAPFNLPYQGNRMLMPRAWLRSFIPATGDANFDGTVNFDDLMQLCQSYGAAGTWSNGDFSGDGLVNFDDIVLLGQHYSGSPSDLQILQSTLAPEPSSMLCLTPFALCRRRRAA